MMLPHDLEDRPVIVVEMPPLTRVKAFATHPGSLTNLGWFSIVVYETCIELKQNRFDFWPILREKSQRREEI